MDPFAHQVHAHAGPDGGNVKRTQHLDHEIKGVQHLLTGHDDLGVVTSDIVGHDAGVFQVDRILPHTDGKSADGRFALPCGNGTDERGVQTAGKQESDLGVCHKALFHAGYQLFMDVGAHGLQIVIANLVHFGDIIIADELAILVIVSRGKRHDFIAHAHKVLRLAGKYDHAFLVVAVIERPNTDGVSGGDKLLAFAVKEDQRKFRIQQLEHLRSVFPVERQKDLAIGAALEGISFRLQLCLTRFIAVYFAVADHIAAIQFKRLHSFRRKTHNGKPMEAQQTVTGIDDTAVIRAAGNGFHEAVRKSGNVGADVTITHDRTHFITLRNVINWNQQYDRASCCDPRCHLSFLLNDFCQSLAAVTGGSIGSPTEGLPCSARSSSGVLPMGVACMASTVPCSLLVRFHGTFPGSNAFCCIHMWLCGQNGELCVILRRTTIRRRSETATCQRRCRFPLHRRERGAPPSWG